MKKGLDEAKDYRLYVAVEHAHVRAPPLFVFHNAVGAGAAQPRFPVLYYEAFGAVAISANYFH